MLDHFTHVPILLLHQKAIAGKAASRVRCADWVRILAGWSVSLWQKVRLHLNLPAQRVTDRQTGRKPVVSWHGARACWRRKCICFPAGGDVEAIFFFVDVVHVSLPWANMIVQCVHVVGGRLAGG